MTRRKRTILFFTLTVLFFLLAPAVIFYSQGYRLDWDNKKITQTGGLFIKAEPKQVEIYINGELAKKTDFLFGSALINNLLPKEYKVRVEKAGYFTWEKTLEIKEKEVTEAKSIVLFPSNMDFLALSKNIEDFWFSPDGKIAALKEKNAQSNNWSLTLYDFPKKIKSALLNEKTISQAGADLLNLEFSKNTPEIFFDVGTKEQIKSFSLRLDKTLALPTKREKPATPANVIAYQETNNSVYYLDKSGYVFKSDSSFTPKEQLNKMAFPVQQETEYKLRILQNSIFMQVNNKLYLFNPDSGTFETFFGPLKDIKLSPDLKKGGYFSNNEIWVLFFSSISEQPSRKAQEKMFLTRFSENIGDVFWLNSDYIVFNIGDKIKVAEIDNRDKINIYNLKELKTNQVKIFFNEADKKLYVLAENNFYASRNPIQ